MIGSKFMEECHGSFVSTLYAGGAQHVIKRGNNREVCFCDEADYKAYLSFPKDAASKYQVAVHPMIRPPTKKIT